MLILNNLNNKLATILFIFFFTGAFIYETSHATGEASPTPKHSLLADKLNDIIKNIRVQKSELEAKLTQLEKTKTEQERTKIQAEINVLSSAVTEQESSFEMILTAGSKLTKNNVTDEEFNWQKDLLDILQPIMSELRELTEYRRRLDDLRKKIITYQLQIHQIDEALEHIAQINKQGLEEDTLLQFTKVSEKWQDQLEENNHLLEVAQLQLDEMIKSQTANEVSISNHFKQFATGRGATLLMALAVFTAVYFSMLMLWKSILWFRTKDSNEEWTYYQRVITFLYRVMMVILAITAAFYVLSVRNDQVLIALAVLLLVTVVWVLKNSIPRYVNELKILLNTGAVREGECITYNGILMRIDNINFYTKLSNPLLPELKLRLPLAELTNYVSRPCNKDEPWFPCKVGDFVRLSDGKYGLVKCITLENVILSLYNGMMPQTYTINDFLAAQPENLSKGFIVTSMIGIDYKYQQQCTHQIPQILCDGIRKGLQQEDWGYSLKEIWVNFAQASTSSLDYKIVAIFDGKAADNYYPITRSLQRYAVDICNQQQWEIPFTQVVVHNRPEQA